MAKEFISKPVHETAGNASPPRAPLLSLAQNEVMARRKMEAGTVEKATNRPTTMYEEFDPEEVCYVRALSSLM